MKNKALHRVNQCSNQIFRNPFNETEKKNMKKSRSQKGLSRSAKRAIDLVTLQSNEQPVGSFKYRSHPYPADIDVFEKTDTCCSVDRIGDGLYAEFQAMFADIKKDPLAFVGDFKAGELDTSMEAGKYNLKTDKYDNYYPSTIQKEARRMYEKKVIDKKTFDRILEITSRKLTTKTHIELDSIIRKIVPLRWTLPELMAGKKKDALGKIRWLQEELASGTMVKIDIWYPVDGNYTEITNVFLIETEVDGKTYVLTNSMNDYVDELRYDVWKYTRPETYNPLKAAKRTWLLLMLLGKNKEAAALLPLFGSGAASLNQIKDEMEVLSLLQKRPTTSVVQDIVWNQTDQFKSRINEINDLKDLDYDGYFSALDRMLDQEKPVYTRTIGKLHADVNKYTDSFLKQL